MVQLRVVIRGYVQGVGFRAFVVREARRLGVVGEVWNRADGAVEVVAEGDRSTLDSLCDLLKRGPSESEVQQVEVVWSEPKGSWTGFEIVY